MNPIARPYVGLVFKCLSLLALIFAFIFFMRMQEEQSENDKLRNQGVVSRALVMDKKKDTTTTQRSGIGRRSSGSTTTNEIWVLTVRHVPKSTVKYTDFPSKVQEADLPIAPPLTGDPMKDMENGGVVWVPEDVYDKTNIGDKLTVVNTPWDSTSPVLVSDVAAFDATVFYPRMAIALVLALLFWLIGWRISKATVRRGMAELATVPGTLP
jgi:hypothetical protein